MLKFKKGVIATALLLGLTFSVSSYAAKDSAVELAAEVIEYDANQKIVQAQGNVKITQDGTIITGPYAEYRNENGMAVMTGGISVSSETIQLTGERVDYDTKSGTAVVTGQPRIQDKDGAWMTGDKIEYYTKEDRAIIAGNVHIVHPGRQLDATAQQGTYFGKERKLLLTGNARVVQEGNTLVGETLTVYTDNKAIEAKGATKIVIIPNEKN